jgi:hypothetical protein
MCVRAGRGLDDKFVELFNYVESTLPVHVHLPHAGKSFATQATRVDNADTEADDDAALLPGAINESKGQSECKYEIDIWLPSLPLHSITGAAHPQTTQAEVAAGVKGSAQGSPVCVSITLDTSAASKEKSGSFVATTTSSAAHVPSSAPVRAWTREQLQLRPVTPLVQMQKLMQQQFDTQADVLRAQQELSGIKNGGCGMTLVQRQELLQLRVDLQARLDEYLKLLADVARGSSTGVSAVARLKDLRYEAKFTKKRRQRTMDIRAARNQARLAKIDARVAALPQVTDEDFKNVDLDLFACDLALTSVKEMMMDAGGDGYDVMGWCLNVSRPEHVVEDPTLLIVNKVRRGCTPSDHRAAGSPSDPRHTCYFVIFVVCLSRCLIVCVLGYNDHLHPLNS